MSSVNGGQVAFEMIRGLALKSNGYGAPGLTRVEKSEPNPKPPIRLH
jgi:hypothetical protein